MTTMTEDAVSKESTAEGLKLRVTKFIRAKRARVFEAWTKPEILQTWFGPEEMNVVSASVDLRVGGAYRIEVARQARAGEESGGVAPAVASGVYREIIQNELLRFTWEGSWNPGEENLVSVSLHDLDGGTELILTHERLSTLKPVEGYEKGWTGSLAKLAKALDVG